MSEALVIGGAGFIGSHLIRRLAEEGRHTRIVSADIRDPRFATAGVEYRHADVTQPLPDDLCPNASIIYNLAAVHTTPGHDDWEYYWTNIRGATNVCDYARRFGIQRLVFTSSISVYGPAETPKTEDSRPEPESAYGQSKLCAEDIHRLWQSEQGANRRLVIARPAVIYGYKEGGNFTRLAALLRHGRFLYPGRKDTIKAHGYVEDLIESFDFMLARNQGQVTYNFASPDRLTIEDICRAFSVVAGYKPATRVAPLSPMLWAAAGMEAMDRLGLRNSINRARIRKLVTSTNIVPQRLQEWGFPFRYDLQTALSRWREMSGGQGFD